MNPEILSSYLSTDLGDNLWDNLVDLERSIQPEQTLLQRLRHFMQIHQDPGLIVCTANLTAGLLRLNPGLELEAFSQDPESLCQRVGKNPLWFLAGSDRDTGVVGCLVRESGSSMRSSYDFSKIIDLDSSPHAHEQQLLLKWMAADHLLKSPVFKKANLLAGTPLINNYVLNKKIMK